MMRSITAIAALAVLAGCGGSQADDNSSSMESRPMAAGDGLPSCYDLVDTGDAALRPLKPQRELFVLIDQTTAFDGRLADNIQKTVAQYLGDEPVAVRVASFSALSQGNYATFEYAGEAEREPTDTMKSKTGMRAIEKLERCLSEQSGELARQVERAVDGSINRASGDFQNSEIMASLSQLSDAVRRSDASEKMVLVASDMLENSSSASFYANSNVRQIDWQAELTKAANQRLLGDFDNARVAVIGAGLLPADAQTQGVRDTEALNNLRTFWENWFANSNAELDDAHYGQPDLMVGL